MLVVRRFLSDSEGKREGQYAGIAYKCDVRMYILCSQSSKHGKSEEGVADGARAEKVLISATVNNIKNAANASRVCGGTKRVKRSKPPQARGASTSNVYNAVRLVIYGYLNKLKP